MNQYKSEQNFIRIEKMNINRKMFSYILFKKLGILKKIRKTRDRSTKPSAAR